MGLIDEETAIERTKRLRREASARYRARNLEARRAQSREYMARKRAEDPEWVKANNDRYLEAFPERWKARKHSYYLANKDKWGPCLARYKAENPQKVKDAIKAWQKRNIEKVRAAGRKSAARPERKARNAARQMGRQAAKLQATPSWANLERIVSFYEFAAELTQATGEPWEVDHIVPLISKMVCGLHCEANLQLLTARENRSKGNRSWPGQ